MRSIFVDRNIRPSDYDKFDSTTLLVTKIFPTIQGEGTFSGTRSVFIRLAGCNLGGKDVSGPGCNFCDTDFRFDNGVPLSFELLYSLCRSLYPGVNSGYQEGRRLIVITGGEPMLQNSLVQFIASAPPELHFQIESNGTRLLKLSKTRVYLVVSPKIISCKGEYSILSKRVFERADCLKFVVSADVNNPYHNLPDYAFDFMKSRRPVFVSPMAVYITEPKIGESPSVSIWDPTLFDHVQCARNHKYAMQLAMDYGFRVSVQMHLFGGVE